MTKVEIAKLAASLIVGTGTGKIVGQIIKNNSAPEGVIDQVTMQSAAFVIGALAGARTKQYTDEQIDKLVAWWKANVTERETV